MTITPNTAELYSAQIPALAALVSLGWDYLSTATCMEMRGGNQGILLRPVLIESMGENSSTRLINFKAPLNAGRMK